MGTSATPPHVPSDKPPSPEELKSALRAVLKTGLPLTPQHAVPALLALRGVWARAVDPRDRLARVDAADKLLRAQLRKLGSPEESEAAKLLFGIGDSRGQNLMGRRTKAAAKLVYHEDHFRKRVEPKLLERLAWALHQDSLQYVPRARKQPPPEASGDTPTITDEDLADEERAQHEMLLSRVWSDVYGLRAELIQRELHRGKQGEERQFAEADEAAQLRMGSLLLLLDDYMERHGERILHGEAEFNAEALIRLAGWRGELTAARARELRWRAAQT